MDTRLLMVARDFVAGELSLDRLQHVVMDLVWDHPIGLIDADTRDLANLIDLRIAEGTGGHISDSELRTLVAEAIAPNATYVLSAGEHAVQARLQVSPFRSSAPTQRRTVAFG